MAQKRTRNWTWTLNNYTDGDIKIWCEPDTQIRYMVFGKETCPTTGTPHLQGFVIFHNPKTFSQVKAFFGDRFHIEQSQGNPSQNIAYCTKDEEYYEVGERPPAQGARSDILDVKEMVKQGATMEDIVEKATSYQAMRAGEMMLKYERMPAPMKRTIKWYFGATGTGKTHDAVVEGHGDIWISQRTLKWWQGYNGQEVVIIDDFRKDFATFHEMLRILDKYPYYVEQKGGGRWLSHKTKTIIITSCYPPEEVYGTREDIGQLLRRIDEIRLYKEIGKWEVYTPTPRNAPKTQVPSQVPQGIQAQADAEKELEEIFS